MAYTSVKYSNTWLGAEGKGDSILLGQTCLQWSFPQAEFGGWRKAEDCNPNALSLTVLTEKSKNSLNPWTIFVSICCMPLEWFLETLSCMVIIQFSRSVVSDSLWPHALPHAQASLSITNSQSSTKLTSLSQWCHPAISFSVIPFSSCPQSLPASVFSNESVLRIRWPKYWSFSFSISPFKEHPGLISFRMDWLDLLSVQGTLKSLLQHHSSKASVLWHSAFFIVQLSHPCMTTGKTTALTRWTFVGKVMSAS